MRIVGAFDIHRGQLTFEYVDTSTGEVARGRIAPADRAHLRVWLARFDGVEDVHFAMEGCTGWRYVAEEVARVGGRAHVAEPADTAALRGKKRRAKTDRSDTAHLRALLESGRGQAGPAPRARWPRSVPWPGYRSSRPRSPRWRSVDR